LIIGLERSGFGPEAVGPAVGFVTILCLAFWRRPVRFALWLAALMIGGAAFRGGGRQLPYAERSFFGVSRVAPRPSGQYHMRVAGVTRGPSGQCHMLRHGTTVHGMQALAPERRREPLTYFHRNGPLGQFFAMTDRPIPRRAVAVVGLGAGSLACYGTPEQRW